MVAHREAVGGAEAGGGRGGDGGGYRQAKLYAYTGSIFGDYRLVQGIGHGAFADVYLGLDLRLGKRVAVKVMNTTLPHPQKVDQFEREARLVAGFDHRHITEVYRYGVEGGVPYIVMKYAPQGSMRTKYSKGTVLPLETAITYACQVAEALGHAHDQGIIHRDVKPANLLVGGSGELLLSDFGIATLTSSKAVSPQDIAGTFPYMAPEQFDAKAVRESDQYALGIVVYEWLTGHVPFQVGESMYTAAIQHRQTLIPPMGGGVPSEVEAVVRRALSKRAEDRFPSVTAFGEALKEAARRFSSAPTRGAQVWLYMDSEHPLQTVAWSADGSRLVVGSLGGTTRVIDTESGRLIRMRYLEGPPLRDAVYEEQEGGGRRRYSEEKSYPEKCLPPSLAHEESLDHLVEQLVRASEATVSLSESLCWRHSFVATGLPTGGPLMRWGAYVHGGERVPPGEDPMSNDQGVFIAWDPTLEQYRAYWKFSVSIPHRPSRLIRGVCTPSQFTARLLRRLFGDLEPLYTGLPCLPITKYSSLGKAILYCSLFSNESIGSLAWSRRAQLVAISHHELGIGPGCRSFIINLATNTLIPFPHTYIVNALAWSPTERILAAAGHDSEVILWDDEGRQLMTFHGEWGVNALAWSPDGTQLAVADGKNLSLYQVR